MRYRAMTSAIFLVLSSFFAADAAEAVTVRLKWFNQAQFARSTSPSRTATTKPPALT